MYKQRYFATVAIIAGIVLSYGAGKGLGIINSSGKSNAGADKQTFLVVYKPGPGWLPGKPVIEQPLKEHGKYMLSLYKSGIMRFAGPFEDNAGGAVVLELSGEEEAKKVVSQDPGVISHIFVYEMHPWQLVQWDQYVKK